MRKTVLPIHPRTGLAALGFRRNGAPIWPVMGGAPDAGEPSGTGEGSEGDGGDDDADDGSDDDEPDKDDEKLGSAGLKALEATKAKYKSERARRQAAETELAALKAKGGGSGDDDETRRRQAELDQREAEATTRANRRILNAEVRAAAAGKFSDPADALKFLDLDQFEVGDDGDVDESDIADAITDLLKQKPYLAAQGGKRTPKPDHRQGGGQKPTGGTLAAGRDAYAARHKKATV